MVEPRCGLRQEQSSLPLHALMFEPWGGLGEERGSLPPSMH